MLQNNTYDVIKAQSFGHSKRNHANDALISFLSCINICLSSDSNFHALGSLSKYTQHLPCISTFAGKHLLPNSECRKNLGVNFTDMALFVRFRKKYFLTTCHLFLTKKTWCTEKSTFI